MNYTECEKLKELETDVIVLSEFINSGGYILASYSDGYLHPEHKSVQEIVFNYLDIDAKQLEVERQHMLDSL